jgi:hypothetical protein
MTDSKTYENKNTGALFKNGKTEGADDRDFSGSLDVEGRAYWISGFLKTSKAGQKYIRLVLKEKDRPAEKSKATPERDTRDEISFV